VAKTGRARAVTDMTEDEFRACLEAEVRKGKPTALKLWADLYVKGEEAEKPDDPLADIIDLERGKRGRAA